LPLPHANTTAGVSWSPDALTIQPRHNQCH
jgi:hypothetical protein